MTLELTCPYCRFSKHIPEDRVPAQAKWATCPQCRQRFQISRDPLNFNTEEPKQEPIVAQAARDSGPIPGRSPAPWERRDDLGLWQGIFQTFKEVLLSPERLFKGLTFNKGIGEPLAFGLLIGSIGGMFGLFWQSLISSGDMLNFGESLFGRFAVLFLFLIMLIVIPLVVTAWMFIYSGILHLLLLIMGAGKNGFEATFRVIAYSQAAQALGAIPFIGSATGFVWQLIVQVVGLREIHETSYLRVIIAFLIPIGFLGLLVVGMVLAFFALMSR